YIKVAYVVDGNEYGFKVGDYDRTKPLIIDPSLAYSTYLGGSLTDYGYGIAIDSSGNMYVSGITSSTDFPTASPIQGSNGGGLDIFVAKINAAGTSLIYSTYLGGSLNDSGCGNIAIDSSGNAYLTGYTYSTDFPTTASPLQGSLAGNRDAFVTKIDASGSTLVYSTYLGGSGYDYPCGWSIAVDSSGNAYVVGETTSTNFPTVSPIQASNAGGYDAFVTKINASGSAFVYSTYLGGSGTDASWSIAVDSSGNAYIGGFTNSTNFPTVSPIQGSNAGFYDAFVAKINASGSALVYSTYLGGSVYDEGYGIAVDSSGNAYISGNTASTNFQTASPIQASNAA
ncbi:MAG: SBBP repeat-containing protein, partial [Pseudomonadota bacterium]